MSGPRGSRRKAFVPSGRPAEKSTSVGAARLPQIGGLSVGLLCLKPIDCVSLVESDNQKIQLLTVDHSARGSMKTAANCVS